MVMYVANCAKDSFLQQILKNRSLLQEEDSIDEITQIFLDEYNGSNNTDVIAHYAPNRSTLSTLPTGSGHILTNQTTDQSSQTVGSMFGNIYLNSSDISLR